MHRERPKVQVKYRPFAIRDRDAVLRLLADLTMSYPESTQWLDRRLSDVLERRARCTLAMRFDCPIGVSIETPKAENSIKLSTLYVAPEWRGLGIGSHLLALARSKWLREGVGRVYVTIDATRLTTVGRFFKAKGWVIEGEVSDRYGPGRAEIVMAWRRAWKCTGAPRSR